MDIKVLASGSKGNAYRISDGKTAILLDAGMTYKELQKALNFTVSSLTAVLISHEHKDHSRAVDKLLEAGVNCCMSQGTAEALRVEHHHRCIIIDNPMKIGTWAVIPFDTVHDAKQPLGYIIQAGATTLLYATDTEYMKYKVKDLTHIMIECNYSKEIIRQNVGDKKIDSDYFKRVIGSHMSLETLLEFFKANDLSKLKKVYLLHLSNDNSNAVLFQEKIQQIVNCEVIAA
jgi:phosphoribosyl 1,2-cyclic phosphodiesterase